MYRTVAFLTLALAASCANSRFDPPQIGKVPAKPPVNDNKSGSAEKTKLIRKDFFSVVVPTSFVEEERDGEDSSLWHLSNSETALDIETGIETMTLDSTLKIYDNYTEESRTIDGEQAKVVSFGYGQRSHLLKNPAMNLVVAAHFTKSSRVKNDLTLWISFSRDDRRGVADRIVHSLRFY